MFYVKHILSITRDKKTIDIKMVWNNYLTLHLSKNTSKYHLVSDNFSIMIKIL